MKKNLIYSILFAAAALVSASCVNETLDLPSGQNPDDSKIIREFVLDIQSKTTFSDDHASLKWSEGDKFGFIATDGNAIVDHNVAINTPETGNTVSIPVSATAVTAYAYYPFIAGNATNPIEKSSTSDGETTYAESYLNAAKLFVSTSQIQKEAGQFYGAMLPMFAKISIPAESETAPTPILFKPAASVIAVNVFGNAAEKVSYVKFTPASGRVAGNLKYDWTAETVAAPVLENAKNTVSVSLETPYAVPAAKPADRSGYIYMAVVPASYAGGKFTVVTETSVYEFETASTIDVTDVYKPVSIPLDLEGKTPVGSYLYYEAFSNAAGHLKAYENDAYGLGTVTTAHGALNIGTKAAAGTLTTPAFDFLGDETKDVKVTFHANGWRGNNKLAVTANVGTVTDGAGIAMLQLVNADDSDRFSMDKSAPITVYVKGATKETKLTFTNDAADGSDSKRFVIDDIAVEEYVASLEVAYLFNGAQKAGSSKWQICKNAYPNNAVSWTIVWANMGSDNNVVVIGSTSKDDNKASCVLGDYIRVGAPMGYAASDTYINAIISEQPMKNVQKVVLKGDTVTNANRHPSKVSLVYSSDDVTYTLIETQDYNAHNGNSNTWTFDAKPSAHYAIVLKYDGTAYMQTMGLQVEHYAVPEI